jgi:hypothetical protein
LDAKAKALQKAAEEEQAAIDLAAAQKNKEEQEELERVMMAQEAAREEKKRRQRQLQLEAEEEALGKFDQYLNASPAVDKAPPASAPVPAPASKIDSAAALAQQTAKAKALAVMEESKLALERARSAAKASNNFSSSALDDDDDMIVGKASSSAAKSMFDAPTHQDTSVPAAKAIRALAPKAVIAESEAADFDPLAEQADDDAPMFALACPEGIPTLTMDAVHLPHGSAVDVTDVQDDANSTAVHQVQQNDFAKDADPLAAHHSKPLIESPAENTSSSLFGDDDNDPLGPSRPASQASAHAAKPPAPAAKPPAPAAKPVASLFGDDDDDGSSSPSAKPPAPKAAPPAKASASLFGDDEDDAASSPLSGLFWSFCFFITFSVYAACLSPFVSRGLQAAKASLLRPQKCRSRRRCLKTTTIRWLNLIR